MLVDFSVTWKPLCESLERLVDESHGGHIDDYWARTGVWGVPAGWRERVLADA